MTWRFWSTAYVQHLEGEIDFLRTQMLHERQKWEVATAELVRLQTAGQANVAPRPLMSSTEDDVRKELSDLMGDAEFSQAGA